MLAATGPEALTMAAECPPDLIIMDLILPDMEGTELICRFRSWTHAPILVLSARRADRDKVAALDQGADDYITKPFSSSELAARVRAALRHQRKTASSTGRLLEIADLQLEIALRQVRVRGGEVRLTPTEYDLLRLLAENVNCLLTYEQILQRVWGEENPGLMALRVHICSLRDKLEQNPARPRYIHTEARVGYRFRAPTNSPDIERSCAVHERGERVTT